jgi:hypothetical protein
MNVLHEPLTPSEAKRHILQALTSGDVRFSSHSLHEMAKDGITQAEALDILRSGVVEPGEFVKSTWRYRVRVRQAVVVTAFRSECAAVVVTAWRIQ